MGSRIVARGLEQIADRISGISIVLPIQMMSVDDRNVAFGSGDTNLGNPVAQYNRAFDSTPTRTGSVVRHVITIPQTDANFMIRRIALHNAPGVTGSSDTLVAGIDGQSFLKQNTFRLRITVDVGYSSI